MSLKYRHIRPGEEKVVVDLVERTFSEFVAPHFSQEGVEEFMGYVSEAALAERLAAGNFIILTLSGDTVVGVIEVRDNSHIALLFVDKRFQRQGIAKALVQQAIAACQQRNPDLAQITVNASPNALTAYQRLGFESTDEEKTHNGIRFTAMALNLAVGRCGRAGLT